MAAIAVHNAEIHEREIALSEIGRALTRGNRLREDEILELIHQYADRLMDIDNMYIALFDEPTDTVRFRLALVDGRHVDVKTEKGWQPRQAGKGRTEAIIRTKRPIFISTKADAEAWYEQPGHEQYTEGPVSPSWMGVPMMVGQRVMGVIATYNPTWEYIYSINDGEILQAMANQVAIALDSTKLYYDVNRRLESLIEIDRLVASSIGMKESEILELIHSQASMLLDADNMHIALYRPDPIQADEYNPENPEQSKNYGTVEFGLAFKDGKQINVEMEKGWQPRKADRGRIEEIIRTKKPILLATKAEAEAWYERPGREDHLTWEKLPSWLGVPMIVGEKVLGVITTYHPTREYVYSGDDLETLQAMADLAAIALDNAALYRRVEKHSSQLETAREIANAIATEVNPQACMERILDETTKLLEASYATVQLVDEATNELVIHAQRGLERKRLAPELQRIKIGEGVTGRVAQTKWTVRLGNVHDVEYYLPYVDGTTSEMATPLIERGKVIGVFNVGDPRENAFDQDDEDLFKLLAEEVVIAVQNARRVEASQREQERRIAEEKFVHLGHAADGIAHRINNTVALLPLCAGDIKRHLEIVDSFVGEQLDMIERNARYILDLAEELQKPSRPSEAGRFSTNRLLEDAIRVANVPSDVDIVTAFDRNLPKVQTRRLLVDVFVELITNAVTAMSESEVKRLEIGSQARDTEFIEVWFTDTGRGIPREEHDRIFDLFYTTSMKEKPTEGVSKGFGLWWVRTFLASQGGEIAVESEPDRRTIFRVRLPSAITL
jgi:GAF domain-containing protein